MKIRIVMLLLCFMVVACKQEPAYRIQGKFKDAPEGTKVYLGKDSATIVNGEFTFKGRADLPELSALRVKAINEYGMPGFKGTRIWLENADMTVTCPWISLPHVYDYSEQMLISGSSLNDLYQDYRRKLAALGGRDSLWKIYQQVYLIPSFTWENVDVKEGMRVMREIEKLSEDKKSLAENFVAEHPASPISLELLTSLIHDQEYTVEEARTLINSLDTTLKNMPAYERLMNAFDEFVPTAKGEKFMDVPLLNQDGNKVRLSDYIIPGKYNMLEFWASWCGPCRGEIPHLRYVHQKWGDRFNIISISIDEKSVDWQKAMKEEKMVWTQLNDGKGFNGEAARKYNINGVPYSLILDGDGRIVAGEARGAGLDIILESLLGE